MIGDPVTLAAQLTVGEVYPFNDASAALFPSYSVVPRTARIMALVPLQRFCFCHVHCARTCAVTLAQGH